MRSVVSALAILGVASAASDFGGNPASSPYYYSEINSSEYDAETDYQSQNDFDEYAETSSQVVSSLTFDGGCFVSAQAIMCNGGGDPLLYMDAAFESEEGFSDDEDDDEDDGHSSMLSNSSLRRSKALATGSGASTPRLQNSNHPPKTSGETTYYEGEVRLQRNPAATRAALQLRGGSLSPIRSRELPQMLVSAAMVVAAFLSLQNARP